MIEKYFILAKVFAVSLSTEHSFTKKNVDSIKLVEGLGVEGDAHFGNTAQHLHIAKKDPDRPNRRQVLLLAAERIAEWQSHGHDVIAGSVGENITTEGLNLEMLSVGSRLVFANGAIILLTGLRRPCNQIEEFSEGLLNRTIVRRACKGPRFLAGVMAVVERSGVVTAGEIIEVALPQKPHEIMGAV